MFVVSTFSNDVFALEKLQVTLKVAHFPLNAQLFAEYAWASYKFKQADNIDPRDVENLDLNHGTVVTLIDGEGSHVIRMVIPFKKGEGGFHADYQYCESRMPSDYVEVGVGIGLMNVNEFIKDAIRSAKRKDTILDDNYCYIRSEDR